MNARDEAEARFLARIQEHAGIIRKIAGAYGRTPADREDLAQEIAAQLWRSYGRYDPAARFSTWMYRVALNTAISHIRRETARRRFESDADLPEVAADAGLAVDERAAQLRELIDSLDPYNRALMVLYLEENSYEEIAAILGLSVTNVGTKINRIKAKLRSAAIAPAKDQ